MKDSLQQSLQLVVSDIRWCQQRGIRRSDAIARTICRRRDTVRAVLRALRAVGGGR